MANGKDEQHVPKTMAEVGRAFGVSPDLVARAEHVRKNSEHLFAACFLGFLTIDQAERVIQHVEENPR